MVLQRGADLRSRPVKEHSLIGLAQAQGVARLLGRPAADVTQGDHLTLADGELRDRLQQDPARLVGGEALLGRAPLDGRPRPHTRIGAAARLEAVDVYGRLVGALDAAALQKREWQDATLALAFGARLV